MSDKDFERSDEPRNKPKATPRPSRKDPSHPRKDVDPKYPKR